MISTFIHITHWLHPRTLGRRARIRVNDNVYTFTNYTMTIVNITNSISKIFLVDNIWRQWRNSLLMRMLMRDFVWNLLHTTRRNNCKLSKVKENIHGCNMFASWILSLFFFNLSSARRGSLCSGEIIPGPSGNDAPLLKRQIKNIAHVALIQSTVHHII